MVSESYAHPEYLVDAAWVDAHKSDEDVVIVDCEIEAAFASCSGFTSTRSARRSVLANGCASSMNACGPSHLPNSRPMTSCFSVERAWATTQKAHSLARVQWARDMV